MPDMNDFHAFKSTGGGSGGGGGGSGCLDILLPWILGAIGIIFFICLLGRICGVM